MRTKAASLFALLILFALIAGCGNSGPAEIHYGEDQCANCKMNVADPAFGSQLISGTGKVFRFDSIECLAAFELKNPEYQQKATLWLADMNHPGSFLRVHDAVIVYGNTLRSPMGLGLAAVGSSEEGLTLAEETEGRVLPWSEVRQYVAEAWNVKQ